MVRIILFVGLLSLVGTSYAFESYLPNSKHPDIHDKCLLKETGDYIEFDQSLTPPGICAKFTCRDDFVIQVDRCVRYMQPPNCEILSGDADQIFPECCPKLSCIDNEGNVETRSTTS